MLRRLDWGAARFSDEVSSVTRPEAGHFRQVGVHRKVPASEATKADTKADSTHRSRHVAKEIKMYNAPELFATTPPVESLKYLLRRVARDRAQSIMHVDVTRTYFYAVGTLVVCMRLTDEDHETHEHDMCGKLVGAMYSTHDAAQIWQRKCAETLEELGATTAKASHATSTTRSGTCVVHRDDTAFVA